VSNGDENTSDLFKRWTTPCELDPELAECLIETDFLGGMIKHKFVNDVYLPQMNARYNEALALKHRMVAEAIAKHEWYTVIFLHERPWRLHALVEIADLVDDTMYWKLVGNVWVDSENIWQNLDEWDEVLSNPRPGREAMMDEEDLPEYAALPEFIRVYRGHGVWNQDGWSWTTDRVKAEWFARRLAQEGDEIFVTEGEVDRDDVIAFFASRGESEIVADPDLVPQLAVWEVSREPRV